MRHTHVIFDRLSRYLADRPEHTARVAFGPACEQWISSEAFVALNWPAVPLPTGTFVLCESCKRDITLFDGDDDHRTALATIEAKLSHPNKNLAEQIRKLRTQIATTLRADETEATERGAILYAIWSDWYDRADSRDEASYHRIVGATFRSEFAAEEFDIVPADGLRAIVESRPVTWLGKPYPVSVFGICAARRAPSQGSPTRI